MSKTPKKDEKEKGFVPIFDKTTKNEDEGEKGKMSNDIDEEQFDDNILVLKPGKKSKSEILNIDIKSDQKIEIIPLKNMAAQSFKSEEVKTEKVIENKPPP